MDEIKKIKSIQKIKQYLKSQKFSQKIDKFTKYHEEKEGKKILENIKKICNENELFFFQSELTNNILIYGIHSNKKCMILFIYILLQ